MVAMKLRNMRLNKKLTLDELGRRARLERSKLSRVERGYAALTEEERGRLAAELGVPAGELTESPAA